jgi:flavin-dependent dehydrogenase
MKYDAIIIGGRISGAVTAMLLARRGYRVLVVDRATFPSDTISTHIIWQRGVARLLEEGFGEQLIALNAPPVGTIELDIGPFSITGRPPSVDSATSAYAPRRKLLDMKLIEAAAAAGAEVREGFPVDELVFDGDRVLGVQGRGRGGSTVIERASVTVGADGANSTMARKVQAPEYNVHPTLTCWYYSYWSALPLERIRFFTRTGRAFGCIPTNDGLVCIVVAWPRDQFAEVKGDIERNFLASLDTAPAFKEEVCAGKREERFYGTAHVPNYFRRPYGAGWALVGDAGYHKDPILAQGITDALRDASLLSKALDNVFAGRAEWDDALGGYEAARNADVEEIYGMNTQYAALEPLPPEMQALMSALRGNQVETDQFLGTMTGAVRVSDFYAPDNVNRILASAQNRAEN